MDPDAIREFARRDWGAAAASKAQYWARRFQQDGWRPAWEASAALLLQVRRHRPEFPTPGDRDLDLQHHVRLRALLDRAAHAFANR